MRARLHVRNHECKPLIGSDRTPEGLAGVRIGDRLIHTTLGESGGQGRDRDPPSSRMQELRAAATLFADQVRRRYPHVCEGQLIGYPDASQPTLA